MTHPAFRRAGALAICLFSVSACVSEQPVASLDGIKTGQVIIARRSKGELGSIPARLAETMRVCWAERDPLFEGFKVSASGDRIALNGPIVGNPPQRFLITLAAAGNGKSGYRIDMEYPVGSNYEFVRSRLARDLKKLENGASPCA